jgi:hypothetical protein
VIHRDLKPGNIMVGAFGEVQVMDWGLTKVLGAEGPAAEEAGVIAPVRTGAEERTAAGAVLGTYAYMAPEQARGDAGLDARADVFGLGAVLCRILTGQPPFVADTPEATWQMAARGKLGECFVRLDGCGADAELIQLAKRCLATERADRPADGAAVAVAVAAYLERVATAGAHNPPPPGTSRFHPREWARVFCYLATLRVFCHGVMALLLLPLGPPPAAYWAWFIGLHVGTWLPVWWLLRSKGGLNPIERGALLNWGATFACDALLFALFCPLWGQARPEEVVRVYSAWPAAHGLWYVAEGRRSWGRFYAVGLAYFVAAPLLLFCGLLAPLAYALIVGCALFWLAHSFWRLAEQQKAGALPSPTGGRF